MGTEFIVGSLVASHLITAFGSWYVGHHGAKATITAIQNVPNDINQLKKDIADIKTKVGM